MVVARMRWTVGEIEEVFVVGELDGLENLYRVIMMKRKTRMVVMRLKVRIPCLWAILKGQTTSWGAFLTLPKSIDPIAQLQSRERKDKKTMDCRLNIKFPQKALTVGKCWNGCRGSKLKKDRIYGEKGEDCEGRSSEKRNSLEVKQHAVFQDQGSASIYNALHAPVHHIPIAAHNDLHSRACG